MATTATEKQFNNYIKLPCSLLSVLPHGQAYVLGDVFSFTGARQNCHRTYKSFGNRVGASRATVGRALRAGKAQELIANDKEKGYVCNLDKVQGDDFLRVLDWVITEEFKVRKNVTRRLLPSERSVYSFLYTRCANGKKRNKVCTVSIAEIAAALCLCERTVQRALWALIRAGLIFRPLKDKGVNAYKKSRYTLNFKIIKAHEKEAKKKKQAKPAAEPPQPKTFAEIEQTYADKRTRAELIAERNLIRARENANFKLWDDVYKSMKIEAAFAPLKCPDRVAEFERRAAQAYAERRIALSAIGLTEDELKPQYECKECNDTGQLTNGARCKCFPRGAPPVGGFNVGVGEQNR